VGADWVSVHQEACRHLDRTLHLIRSHGALAGVVINPATPVDTLTEVAGYRGLCTGHVGQPRVRRAEVFAEFPAQNA